MFTTSGLASPFPAFTRSVAAGGFGRGDDGALSAMAATGGSNRVFETVMECGPLAVDSGGGVDRFAVRLWGPGNLFGGDTAAADAATIIGNMAAPRHRLVLMLHGAGMSRMSFHLLACAMLGIDRDSEVRPVPSALQLAQVVAPGSAASTATATATATSLAPPRLVCAAFDYRGHGKTVMADSNAPCDLESLASDVCRVATRIFALVDAAHDGGGGASSGFWTDDRCVCLVGHSLGGSVACAVSDLSAWRQRVFGLILLDIVEGTALESVKHMPDFLKRRPREFPGGENEAIGWFVRAGGMRHAQHARVSVPSLLRPKHIGDGDAATAHSAAAAVEWITDLAATEPHWHGWFGGMDGRFLRAICPRMLCLATRDTLDKDLTVAHMQGQFQLEVFRDCGHYLMEDAPSLVAPVLLRFIQRVEQQSEKLRQMYLRKFGTSVPTS